MLYVWRDKHIRVSLRVIGMLPNKLWRLQKPVTSEQLRGQQIHHQQISQGQDDGLQQTHGSTQAFEERKGSGQKQENHRRALTLKQEGHEHAIALERDVHQQALEVQTNTTHLKKQHHFKLMQLCRLSSE